MTETTAYASITRCSCGNPGAPEWLFKTQDRDTVHHAFECGACGRHTGFVALPHEAATLWEKIALICI